MVTSLETLWNLAIVAAVDVEMSKNSLQLIWEKLMTDHWVWVGYGGQAIFFSRCAFPASMVVRIWVLASPMSS